MNDSELQTKKDNDKFSKVFFFIIPLTVPIIVTFATYLFYPICAEANLIWLPLILIYWITIWGYIVIYRKFRGGIFNEERYELTLKLKGDHLWLQYLVVYGPLIYTIPIFIVWYAINPKFSIAMWIVILILSIINGPSEETFWRACMEDMGINAGASERLRLVYSSITFGLWHTAFVIHLVPMDDAWIMYWLITIGTTTISGLIWHWTMHRSKRLFPQIFYHSCANFFSVFPALIIIIEFYF
jgi:membrane protease YdiL (CAAX protease family)